MGPSVKFVSPNKGLILKNWGSIRRKFDRTGGDGKPNSFCNSVGHFAEFKSRRHPLEFTQDMMPHFRKRMIYEIVKSDLMYP